MSVAHDTTQCNKRFGKHATFLEHWKAILTQIGQSMLANNFHVYC